MKGRYRYCGHSIGRFKCVTWAGPGSDGLDRCLSGKLGEVWQYSPMYLRAIRTKSFNPTGNEKLITFGIEELEKWVLKLKIPRSTDIQALWANNPNLRHTLVDDHES